MKSIHSERPDRVLLNFFLSENIPLSADTVFAVCFSGGRDSTALLLMMKDLSRKYSFSLKAVYVRHNIREEEECVREENHIRSFCLNENIHLRVEEIPFGFIRRLASGENRSVEEVARTERYRIFADLRKTGWADWFLTAHHLDDNFETVLYRIFQGAGVSGVKGIPPRSGYFLRPLLSVPGAVLNAYLKDKSVSWFTDSSNYDLSFLRNRYRQIVLPFLQKEIPGFASGLKRFIGKMNEADKKISSGTADFSFTQADNIVTIQREKWDSLPDWEKTESLYRALQTVLNENERARISYDFLNELKNSFGEKLYRGVRIRIDSHSIVFSPPGQDCFRKDFCIDISMPGEYAFPEGKVKVEISSEPNPKAAFAFPAEAVVPPVFFRTLRFGDNRLKTDCDFFPATIPDCCIGDRNGLLAVFKNGRRFRKKNADLEKNRFFNYYIS